MSARQPTRQSIAVQRKDIDTLIPYARNARTHSDEQVAQIAASIREFGWTNPVLIDSEGGVVAGHGRLMAARKLRDAAVAIPNWDDPATVPVIELGHLTDAQRRAYVLADNKIALNAGWDYDLLAVELSDLRAFEFDTSLAGFADAEVDALLGQAAAGADPGDGNEHGEHKDEDFWPEVKLKVHPETMETFESLMAQAPGDSDAVRFEAILNCVNRAALTEYPQ